jgi:hypothetical protein
MNFCDVVAPAGLRALAFERFQLSSLSGQIADGLFFAPQFPDFDLDAGDDQFIECCRSHAAEETPNSGTIDAMAENCTATARLSSAALGGAAHFPAIHLFRLLIYMYKYIYMIYIVI